jgi:TatD DNase family protein
MTDAHCHPRDLLEFLKGAEDERRETGTACAASSWNREEFEYHESLARIAQEEGAPRLFCCFALHPQLSVPSEPSALREPSAPSADGGFSPAAGLETLRSLAADGRLDAVGETGFDLYNESFRTGEKIQDEMFVLHLETALRYDLPLVLHVRRAMHKIFPFAKDLKKLPAVVFHSWPGARGEGEALLRRGVNAFFSFGTVVLKNHREAMACAARFPPDRILLETDAPYQPLRGKTFSSWRDLDAICSGLAALRKEAGSPCATPEELEAQTTANFFRVFA